MERVLGASEKNNNNNNNKITDETKNKILSDDIWDHNQLVVLNACSAVLLIHSYDNIS
jgi:hypothetical protein